MKSISSEEFFKLISINSEITDLESVKRFYYGMIRTISRELKGKGKIKLPDLGEFVLKVRKVRKGYDINTKTMVPRTPIAVVRFVPDHKIKKYFYNMGKESTML